MLANHPPTHPRTEKMLVYDDVDEDVLLCYHEMTLANLIFHTMKEGACSEQSSRMTAMDGASKNAGTVYAVGFLSPPLFPSISLPPPFPCFY